MSERKDNNDRDPAAVESPSSAGTSKSSSWDRWVKLGFVVVTAAAVIAIVLNQRREPAFKGWDRDVDAALKQADDEDRKVLAFFVSDTPSATATRLRDTTLAKRHNAEAVRKGKFIRLLVKIDSLTSDLARHYKIRELPTMMVLSPAAKELNRREGFIGEVDFRKGFLDCSVVERP